MEVEKVVLHMNPGDGENSYAKNSTCQKIGMMKTKHVLEYSLKKNWNHDQFPKSFRMADLGCSSGPNALLSISYAIDVIDQICQQYNHKMPEFQVFLNDLPSNDFNQLFKLLPPFHEKLKEEKGADYCCFISGVPRSYYNRLFPSNSLHFVSCIYGVHWLSKVPEGLENNRGNIHLAKSSPRDVFEAYLKQFQEDFFNFLRFRGQEIKPGGVMILVYVGRSTPNPFIKDAIEIFAMMAEILLQMAAEGLVEEAKVDSFNFPTHFPYKEEVVTIIQAEGSFNLEKLEIFEVNWDGTANNDNDCDFGNSHRIKIIANTVRAFSEPMLANHFGTSILDELFERYEKHVARRLTKADSYFLSHVIALTRK